MITTIRTRVVPVAREVLAGMGRDHLGSFAAALAFKALFSLAPFTLLAISAAGIFGSARSLNDLVDRLEPTMPREAITLIRDQVAALTDTSAEGALTISAIIAAAVALWSISGAFRSVMEAMNVVYGVPETRGKVAVYLRSLLLSVISIGIFLSALTLVVAGPAIARWVSEAIGAGDLFVTLWMILQWPLLIGLVLAAFDLIYHLSPSTPEPRRVPTIGSIFATTAWLLFSLGFSFYANNFGSYNKTYGALAGVFVLMLYLNYSAMVLLIGAEVNRVLGRTAKPPEGAIDPDPDWQIGEREGATAQV